MNGRFSMNFTHSNNNKLENVYRKGEAQYHNYSNVKRSTKIDTSISQPSENILINEGIPSITNTYTTPFTPVNNHVTTTNRQISMTPRQYGRQKVVGPGTMSQFLMSPPTGSGCSACGGR
tara:strand:- start:31 stop:390 length:360 start_codon:yes stop_codon:yes gene_type:complete